MAERGYSRTWQQCWVKVKNLVLTCVSCKVSYAFFAYTPVASSNMLISAASISSVLSLACFFEASYKLVNNTVPRKPPRKLMEIIFFSPCHMTVTCTSEVRMRTHTYNRSDIQFTLLNDSVDVIEVDWKRIQTGSMNSHWMRIESGL